MRFSQPLISGLLLKRYKRFLADIELDTGEVVTAHCANPGAMLGLVATGSRVWLSKSDSATRKLAHSWEIARADFGWGSRLVGVNTARANAIATEAVEAGFFTEFEGYAPPRREVKYGVSSRVDLLLESEGKPPCYVEIKSVTLTRRAELAEFPDSVTTRGAKHLVELGDMVERGARAVMLYVIQMEAERFALAADIDRKYAEAFALAKKRGVEAIAVVCDVGLEEIVVARRVEMAG